MGFIRGGAFVIASVLLFILFLAGHVLWTLNSSLEYDVLKPELVTIVKGMAEEQGFDSNTINQRYPAMQLDCLNNSDFVFRQGEYAFDMPCEILTQGTDAVLDRGINDILENIYYDDYDCDFLDCFELTSPPFFLVSKKAQDYWADKFYLVVFGILILIGLMFLLIESKTNLPFVVGSSLLVSSLPFMKLEVLMSFFAEKTFLQIFAIAFTQSYSAFLIGFGISIGILIFGIFLKFFGIGFKLADFFNKFKKKGGVSKDDVKEMVKKEVKKEKEAAKIIIPGEKKMKEESVGEKKEGQKQKQESKK